MVDLPGAMRIVDARSGKLLDEPRVDRPQQEVPAANLDSGALSRLGDEVNALAPAFFDGAPAVPESLAKIAAQYRQDFPRAVQPEFIPFYKKYATEWFAWVGMP
jgi:hypothetical protein